jgi:hypothetical protein
MLNSTVPDGQGLNRNFIGIGASIVHPQQVVDAQLQLMVGLWLPCLKVHDPAAISAN